MRQRTIKSKFELAGVSLHSGKIVRAKFLPALPNQGIVFQRIIDGKLFSVLANPSNCVDALLCTKIANGEMQVQTIEHLMAALNALLIDNIIIQLDSEEFPILDGGSALLYDKLTEVGVKKQAALKLMYVINKEVIVREGDKFAKFTPSSKSIFKFTCDFSERGIEEQNFTFELKPEKFREQIARARTFGFLSDKEKLQKAGLALGASPENILILDELGAVNENDLNYKNEIVRHKILDAIGDIYLVGVRVLGEYEGYKASHKLNSKLVLAMLNNKAASLKPYKASSSYAKEWWKLLIKPQTI